MAGPVQHAACVQKQVDMYQGIQHICLLSRAQADKIDSTVPHLAKGRGVGGAWSPAQEKPFYIWALYFRVITSETASYTSIGTVII